jgi:PAS domain S-box-containing protein
VNQAFVTILGYDKKEDILKLKVSDIYFDSQQRMQFSEKMSRQGFLKNEELILKKKDETPIIASDTGKAVSDRDGSILYFEGILEDITERKKVEQELEQYRHHLEELVKERTTALTHTNVKLQQEIAERKLMDILWRKRQGTPWIQSFTSLTSRPAAPVRTLSPKCFPRVLW